MSSPNQRRTYQIILGEGVNERNSVSPTKKAKKVEKNQNFIYTFFMNRYRNPLRRSLLAGIVVAVVVLSLVIGMLGFFIYARDMISRFQNYAGDAIDFLARRIDGDDFENCMNTGVKSTHYEEMQILANEFKETHDLEFIYIIKPIKRDPPDNMMDVFAAWTSWGKADGTDGLTDLGNFTGDAYPPEVAEQYMARMDKNPGITYFRNDTDFGKIYTAIRPLFNSKGEPFAVICGDILIDDIFNAAKRYLLMSVISALLFAAIMLFVMDKWLGKRIIKPISSLKTAAEEIEEKCRARAEVTQLVMEDPNITTGDEIEALSHAISSMVEDIQHYAADLLSKDDEISSMKEYVNKMDVLAYRDSLTGAGNKAAYEKARVRLDWDILGGTASFGIVMADLNYLKKINDTFGHDKGNEYLRKMHAMMTEVFTESPLFRIGGDEFVLIVEGDEMKNCAELITKLKENISRLLSDKTLEPWERVSTAIGYALYEKNVDSDTESVFKRADEAMYADKKAMHASRE